MYHVQLDVACSLSQMQYVELTEGRTAAFVTCCKIPHSLKSHTLVAATELNALVVR